MYIGRIQPGKTPADIKIRLQKQRPKNFKGHSIGCSDVIVITDDGKTTVYYVNKDGFIIIPEFLMNPQKHWEILGVFRIFIRSYGDLV